MDLRSAIRVVFHHLCISAGQFFRGLSLPTFDQKWKRTLKWLDDINHQNLRLVWYGEFERAFTGIERYGERSVGTRIRVIN
jgi:hypothetical protein